MYVDNIYLTTALLCRELGAFTPECRDNYLRHLSADVPRPGFASCDVVEVFLFSGYNVATNNNNNNGNSS